MVKHLGKIAPQECFSSQPQAPACVGATPKPGNEATKADFPTGALKHSPNPVYNLDGPCYSKDRIPGSSTSSRTWKNLFLPTQPYTDTPFPCRTVPQGPRSPVWPTIYVKEESMVLINTHVPHSSMVYPMVYFLSNRSLAQTSVSMKVQAIKISKLSKFTLHPAFQRKERDSQEEHTTNAMQSAYKTREQFSTFCYVAY